MTNPSYIIVWFLRMAWMQNHLIWGLKDLDEQGYLARKTLPRRTKLRAQVANKALVFKMSRHQDRKHLQKTQCNQSPSFEAS